MLSEANGKPEHIVRLTWYVLDKQEYLTSLKEVGAAYRELMGRHYPTMAVVQVSGLVEDEARLEIEATAVIAMKVSVIGGGPGGLYFALLAKKAWPRWDITVLRAQPPGRHLRLRRGVLRPDARRLQGVRPASPTSASAAASPTGATSTWSTRAR